MPQIKLYGDLRDPWTWGNGYGFKIISNRRKRIEILREKKVMQHFNKIFLPIESMVEYMKSNYPENANKIFLLPHAYDADDVNSIAEFTRKSIDGKINLIFYGALYDFLKKEMLFVAEMLAKQNNISLQIYSDTVSYAEIFAKHDILKKKVFYNKTVSVKKIFEKIRSSDFVLMIHPKDIYTNGITTKFYEIVSLRIPILFIGYDPFVKNFLEKNKLGIYINPQETVDLLPLLSEFKYNDRFDVEKHSFESVTKELINFIS
jgi:hypothetical protein